MMNCRQAFKAYKLYLIRAAELSTSASLLLERPTGSILYEVDRMALSMRGSLLNVCLLCVLK